MSLRERFQSAWNAFRAKDRNPESGSPSYTQTIGGANSSRPDKHTMRYGNGKSIINAIYNRVANDCASVTIEHVKVDGNENYVETMGSDLNRCLTLEANLDQSARDFKLDAVLSMLDEGVVALCPIDTSIDIMNNNAFDIETIRVCKIVAWYPETVLVEAYNEKRGSTENLYFPKRAVAILENPFYNVMNAPNSTLRRLINKLNLLDAIDNKNGNAKLDLIIQLPYTIKSEARQQQAENRRQSIINQLESSDYGIAYIDATEHITQLNRAVESNLMPQIEYLTKLLYSQLGISEEVFSGTAKEEDLLNYQNRLVEPILATITNEMTRKWITKTGYTQGQRIQYHKEPFKLVPVSQLADIADKFTRNEILTANEFRSIIGFKASSDPKANELLNKNMPADKTADANSLALPNSTDQDETALDENQNGISTDESDDSQMDPEFDSQVNAQLDQIEQLVDEDPDQAEAMLNQLLSQIGAT